MKVLAEGVETRVFLKQRPIFYLHEVQGWAEATELALFPEAQGAYSVLVQWRDRNGRLGVENWDFVVGSETEDQSTPGRVDTRASWCACA